MEVKITDNSKLFKNAKDAAVKRALEAIGLTAERHAKEKCPVVTGRLWNSITHATSEYSGKGSYTDNRGNGFNDANARSTPEDGSVYIGTNVVYAKGIETGTHRKKGAAHFLRDAASQHSDEYKRIIEENLKGS